MMAPILGKEETELLKKIVIQYALSFFSSCTKELVILHFVHNMWFKQIRSCLVSVKRTKDELFSYVLSFIWRNISLFMLLNRH